MERGGFIGKHAPYCPAWMVRRPFAPVQWSTWRQEEKSLTDHGEDPLFLNDPPARVLLACPRRFVRFTNSPQQCSFVIAGSEGDPNWQKAVNGISSACGVFPRRVKEWNVKISTFKDSRNPVLPANELTFNLGGRWEHKHNCD